VVLAFTQRFGHEDFILQKSLCKVLKELGQHFLQFLKFKIIFTDKVTALLKSVKSGK
jgi:hypothetical protein